MMKFIVNGEPYVFQHKCTPSEKGSQMNQFEKKELLISNLLDIYRRCNMSASRYEKPKASFWQRLKGDSASTEYPDICIENFHGTKGVRAYYYVRPRGVEPKVNVDELPEDIKNSWVKIIYGSVFCLERQTPDDYVKGSHFAAQYISKAVCPIQANQSMNRMMDDRELAEKYAAAWQNLDADSLSDILDKDFHYVNDSIFDEMSSREEYLDYLRGKFSVLRRTQSIQRVQLGRNGESGGWAVLIKQIQNDGSPIVCGFFVNSVAGRIKSVEVHEMDLPDF